MDSVEGRKGGKVLLTIYFRNSSLMLAFIRDNNTAKSVTEIFEWRARRLSGAVSAQLSWNVDRTSAAGTDLACVEAAEKFP